jgi:hypothetical protein
MHDDASGIVATLAPYLHRLISAARFLQQLIQHGPAVPIARKLRVLIERAGFRVMVEYSSTPITKLRGSKPRHRNR